MWISTIGRPTPGVPSPRKQVTEFVPAGPEPGQSQAVDQRDRIESVVQTSRRPGQGNQYHCRSENPGNQPLDDSAAKPGGAADRGQGLPLLAAARDLLEQRVRCAADRQDSDRQDAESTSAGRIAAPPAPNSERLIDPMGRLARVGTVGMDAVEVAAGHNAGGGKWRRRSRRTEVGAEKLCWTLRA